MIQDVGHAGDRAAECINTLSTTLMSRSPDETYASLVLPYPILRCSGGIGSPNGAQVLHLLGEPRWVLARLREAEIVAERLNDDRRGGRVCAFTTPVHARLGKLDEALASGTRALEIARMLGDLELCVLSTSLLEQAHYYRGEYERVVELATTNLAAVPGDRIYDYFGNFAPPGAFDRLWLVHSLVELGRFTQAVKDEAEMIRIAESMQLAVMVSASYWTSGVVRLWEGSWAKARLLLEHGLARARARNVMLVLPPAVAASAWVLAQLGEASEAASRVREDEELLERYATGGHVSNLAWARNMPASGLSRP